MSWRVLGRLGKETGGAVAPTVALSLIGLIAAGGLAFDYARMAAMDTELQNAADQAALAAASQLDGKAGACTRAALAASSLVSNDTLFANETTNIGITISVANEGTCDAAGSIRFYQDKAKTTAATADANANFVQVQVATRRANYAFTAIISAMFQDLTAYAFAGVDSAVCKVPPMMICNPNPGTPFEPDNYKGVGLKLFQGSKNKWAPGAFGYLDVGATNNGTPDQRIAMGMDSPTVSCVSENSAGVDTGVAASVLDAINVRFDVFQNGWSRNDCGPSTSCSPSTNTTKDLVRKNPAGGNINVCDIKNNEWELPSTNNQYIAQNAAGDDATVDHMGYPMDICHYPLGGGCAGGFIGNGTWRRDIYFKTNHSNHGSNPTGSNWQAITLLPANASRYAFYQWELSSNNRPSVTRGGLTQFGAPTCKPPGLGAGPSQPDRRVIAVAVADNCAALNGNASSVSIGAWADAFLVMPVVPRPTDAGGEKLIYVEIIGRSKASGNGTNGQLVRRDVPYLIE